MTFLNSDPNGYISVIYSFYSLNDTCYNELIYIMIDDYALDLSHFTYIHMPTVT